MRETRVKRRQFLQSLAAIGALGSGIFPNPVTVSTAEAMSAGVQPLQNKLLVDLFLNGGPDFRHLVVPQYVDPQVDTQGDVQRQFAQKYWQNRQRSHNLAGANQSAQERWNNDYVHFTVGDSGTNWSASLVDIDGLNSGLVFGIWKEASWLIDMFRAGNVALVFNAVCGTNRAHDLSTLMLHQGNVFSGLNNRDRSGWGGRLARSAGGKAISLTNSPTPFNFGPVGDAPNYNPDAIDNKDLVSISDSRDIGLFDNQDNYEFNDPDNKLGRAAKRYYSGLRADRLSNYRSVSLAHQRFLSHEQAVREFGELIDQRLIGDDESNPVVPIPTLIEALYRGTSGINPNPNDVTETERIVLHRRSLGSQIRNLYDVIALNDIMKPTVCSLSYGGWDTHSQQREIPAGLDSDPNNPDADRGIENGLRDIFLGQWLDNGNQTASDPSALHGAFSALWQNLSQADRDKIAITISGEFGRQIRDNGDSGTDHGRGNLMLVIGEQCNGGIYGEMFPAAEIIKYDEAPNRTPDITPLTEIDQLFSKVCDWVATNSGESVFPRMSQSFVGDTPDIEVANMFDNLFS